MAVNVMLCFQTERMANSTVSAVVSDTDRRENPVIYIQCDWNESLREVRGEAWISCKYRGQKSYQGKILSKGISKEGVPSVSVSEGFSIKALLRGSIYVKHDDSGHSCVFEAPSNMFSGLHKKSVVSLDVTSGGLGVSVCTDNALIIWDTSQGLLRRSLTSHLGNVYRCRFFPSGMVVLSGGADMQLKIWSAETGQCAVTLSGHTSSITDFAFVERGRNIISVSKDGTAKLWDCGESRCLGNLAEIRSTINCCKLCSAQDMQLGEPEEPPSEREVGTEGKVLLLGCEDGSVHYIAVRSRRMLFSVMLGSAVNSLAFLSDQQFAVGTHDGQVRCFNLEDPVQPYLSWFESNSAVLSIAPFMQKGIFVGRADGSCTYHHYGNGTGEPRIQLTGPDCDPIYDISTDGMYVYTACRDATIRKYAVARMLTNLAKTS